MITLDLTNERAVDIGSSYSIDVRLCNAPDLTPYTGKSQIKSNAQSTTVILEPVVTVLTKDTFNFKIPFNLFTAEIAQGSYSYDVLFSSATDRFYAVGGKIQLVQRITKLS